MNKPLKGDAVPSISPAGLPGYLCKKKPMEQGPPYGCKTQRTELKTSTLPRELKAHSHSHGAYEQ